MSGQATYVCLMTVLIAQVFPENIRNGIVAIAIRNAAQRSSASLDLVGHGGLSSPVHQPSCGPGGCVAETKLYDEVTTLKLSHSEHVSRDDHHRLKIMAAHHVGL